MRTPCTSFPRLRHAIDVGGARSWSALRRLVEVADVAAAVEYLLSDGAGNITGTVLTVDAGNTA